jgi:ankyrin repeat protein
LRALLERGADVNARAAIDERGVGGQTPLFHAATQFRDFGLEAVRFLIASGADMTVRAVVPSEYDKPNETLNVTALGYAARFPHSEWECHGTAALLKDAGAPAGDIYAAAKLGMTEELRQLLESSADPNTAHPHGETALAAATRNGHTPAVSLLRDAGARE